jgi:hypothetical protein
MEFKIYRNRKAGRFIKWLDMKQGSNRQLFGDANVYFSSGMSLHKYSGNKYCFQPGDGEMSILPHLRLLLFLTLVKLKVFCLKCLCKD